MTRSGWSWLNRSVACATLILEGARFEMPGICRKKQTDWALMLDALRYESDRRYRLRIDYFRKIRRGWPDWAADKYYDDLKRIYKECDRRRAKGEDCEVDHIVPLRGTSVCGLHVPWNLQIIHRLENLAKSNKWWPDAPFERLRLEVDQCQIEQRELQL